MTSSTRTGLAAVVAGLALVAAIPNGNAQAPRAIPTGKENPPSVSHLVGHEESALLEIIQSAIDDWDPRALVNPYLKKIPGKTPEENDRYQIRRPDLLEFIADADAAVRLGKAFFWEMQAGSDFTDIGAGQFAGTACASCHYRFGQDARNRHTSRVPYVGWEKYQLDTKHPVKPTAGPYDPQKGEFQQLPQKNNVTVPNFGPPNPDPEKFDGKPKWTPTEPTDPLNLSVIVGSQGVDRKLFENLEQPPRKTTINGKEVSWFVEIGKESKPSTAKTPFEWEMFREGNRDLRQITSRNSPSVINATFADRLFHDGRADSTFNGFSIFGDHDRREVIYKRTHDLPTRLIPVSIAISHAALASQAVGPIVNEVEMSYKGRTFPDLAEKLLRSRVLFAQTIDGNDSVFQGSGIQEKTYEELIKAAFRREWWDDSGVTNPQVDLELKLKQAIAVPAEGEARRVPEKGTIRQANFPLYWGLSLMLYQSTLISNNSPFDQMMRGKPQGIWDAWERHKGRVGNVRLDRVLYSEPHKPGAEPIPREEVDEASRLRALRAEKGEKPTIPTNNPKIIATAVFQRGMRVFERADCRDCHDGPNKSELYDRTANNRIVDGIAKTLSHTLFPNAQGDAAAIVLAKTRERLIAELTSDLRDLEPGLAELVAKNIARELLRRTSELEGEFAQLDGTIERTLLNGFKIITDKPTRKKIGDKLIQFELFGRNGLGRRPFFNEQQRIAQAELITGPVLIEKMLIPTNQLFARPRLPSGGDLTVPHAFYDAGFYGLGVTHPRFDRGIGGITPINVEEDDTTEAGSLAAIKQAARGVSGSAYRFQADRKGRGANTAGKYAAPKTVPQKAPNNMVPASTDFSWSRTELPPDISWEDMIDPRRSRTHFKSRSRELVVDEEAWGHRKPFLHDNELMFWGNFKTPSLRNVELTAPYMHNGQLQTLEEVIEFYDHGGLIARSEKYNPDKHPRIRKSNLTIDDKKALLFFLLCLTDEAVRMEKAQFDHPSIRVPNGYETNQQQWICISARGRKGGAEMKSFPSDQ